MEANVEHHMGVYGGWESKFARSASPEPRGRAFAGPCVYVNVYDITDIGIYGYCDRDGRLHERPLDAYGASHRSRVPMGRCGLDARAIERRLARLVALWQGNTYALLTRNCCHFCDALCAELGVGPIPAWVNGLARSVHGFTDFPAVKALVARAEHEHPALRAHHPVWKSNLQLDFNALEEYKDALGSDSDDDDDDDVSIAVGSSADGFDDVDSDESFDDYDDESDDASSAGASSDGGGAVAAVPRRPPSTGGRQRRPAPAGPPARRAAADAWTPICGPLALATACFSGDDAAALRGGDAYAALPPMDYGFLGDAASPARDASPAGPGRRLGPAGGPRRRRRRSAASKPGGAAAAAGAGAGRGGDATSGSFGGGGARRRRRRGGGGRGGGGRAAASGPAAASGRAAASGAAAAARRRRRGAATTPLTLAATRRAVPSAVTDSPPSNVASSRRLRRARGGGGASTKWRACTGSPSWASMEVSGLDVDRRS
ncbi:PPPDE putative peptidase domain-containing protein [Aureococcus anophagefferens]|nr:PPPDE putative peptidase domain-containing protein [Aureococcus anophagefferens]